jgi:hypothetical protein
MFFPLFLMTERLLMRVLLLILYSFSLQLPDLFGQQLEFFGAPASIQYYQPRQAGRTVFDQTPAASIHVGINDLIILGAPLSMQMSWTTGTLLQKNLSGSQAGHFSLKHGRPGVILASDFIP